MTYYVFEGKNDYIASYPAMIVTLKASGSISAGKAVAWDAGGTSEVYQPTLAVASGIIPAGVALQATADNGRCPVLVWGFAKNLTAASGYTPAPGDTIQISGSGNFYSLSTGSFLTSPYAAAGKTISGSAAGAFMAFINCMGN